MARGMMAKSVLLVCVVTGLLHVSAGAQVQHARVEFPGIGVVTIEAHVTEAEPFAFPYLSFSDSEGRILTQVGFMGHGPAASRILLKFSIVSLPDLPGPWIVAAAGDLGGSDSGFETTIIGVSEGKLRDLMPEHVQTNIQGAVCAGRFGREPRPGVLVLKEIWEPGEGHYGPHRYSIARYDWDGATLKPISTTETRAQHPGWREAALEQGYHCKRDFVALLVPEYR